MMASPPYSYSSNTISPTSHNYGQASISVNTHVFASKKRPAADGSDGSALQKRRKASTMSAVSAASSSVHPLRQTSFPPLDGDENELADDTSLVSGSQVSTNCQNSTVGPVRKKRGRKSKAAMAVAAAGWDATPSLLGEKNGTAGPNEASGAKSTTAGGAADEDDEDANAEVAIAGAERTKQEEEEEQRLRIMLVNALSPEQFARYENWRASSLSKPAVRKLINATISQSVNDGIVLGVKAVSKVFLGDIIESARRVQGEWLEKGQTQTDLPTPAPTPDADGHARPAPHRNDARGPLLPEHLREAMRRYKLGCEGGGVGSVGLWHQQQMNGADRFPLRTGGRRIFR